MPLIDRSGSQIDDPWRYPAEAEEPAQVENAIVRLAQWEAYCASVPAAPAGVWVTGDQDVADLLPLLEQLQVIVIEFPKSRDGRGFTLARVLRERHHYGGDIRATGPLLPDQFAMLTQCGFSSLLAPDTVPVQRWRDAASALAQGSVKPITLLDRLSRGRR